jgi:tetratricopeptide (TPR) repeat protein
MCVALTAVLAGCASHRAVPPPSAATAPRFPDYPMPDIPSTLRVPAAVADQHRAAWQWLQAGDLRRATREFTALLKQDPDFYPAHAGLGFALLADREYKAAAAQFTTAVRANERYLPAWSGLAEADLGLKDDAGARAAMERILALDPKQTAVQSRLDLLRFRQVQTLIDSGRRARAAGRLPEADRLLSEALALSPESTAILRDLIDVEVSAGALDDAEAHARAAVQIDASDAEAQARLATVLEARQKFRDASAAFTRANALEPRAEWRDRARALRMKADLAAIPAEFADIEHASTLTRAQVAAFVGIRLEALLARAPSRPLGVATDIRDHWAAPWIVPALQAGIMDIYANHTFQPSGAVRRNDLAQIVARLVAVAAAGTPELMRWQAARPRLADVPAGNVFYRPIALALASGAMIAEADRFFPARPATGADLAAAVARVDQLARR